MDNYTNTKNEITYGTYDERDTRMSDKGYDIDASYMAPEIKIVPDKREKKVFKKLFNSDFSMLTKQTLFDDNNERAEAFAETIRYLVITDDSDLRNTGFDVWCAMKHGNMEHLLISICGYGGYNIAKMAMLMRDDERYFHEKVAGTIVVYWDNGKTSYSDCQIDAAYLGVWDYAEDVMKNPWNDGAQIKMVTVIVNPLGDGMDHEFKCVSMDTMIKSKNNSLYWFTPDPNVEPECYMEYEEDEDTE